MNILIFSEEPNYKLRMEVKKGNIQELRCCLIQSSYRKLCKFLLVALKESSASLISPET